MRYFYFYLYLLLWLFAFFAPLMRRKVQNALLLIYSTIWALVFGLRRSDVGNDTSGYTAYFENSGRAEGYGTVDHPFDTAEEGFVFLSRVINLFTENATVVFLLLGFSMWIVIYKLYKNNSKTPLLALLFMLIVSPSLVYTLGIAVRQQMAMIIIGIGMLYADKIKRSQFKSLIHDRNAIIAFSLFLFSVTVHRTIGALCLFLLVAYFVQFSKKKLYIIIAFMGFFVLFTAKYAEVIFNTVLVFVGGLDNDNVNLLGDRYMGDIDSTKFKMGYFLLWVVLATASVHFSKKDQINNYFFKLFILTYVLHQLVQFTPMHDRLTSLFIMLGFSKSIPDVCVKSKKLYYSYMMLALLLLIRSYRVYTAWPKDDSFVPYYFIWQ